MKFFWCTILVAFLCSCHQENLTYDKPYFDFDSLVHKQVQLLSQHNCKVVKETFLNGKADSALLLPDTIQWKYELDAFQQLDAINKPLFKGNYQEQDQDDEHSNLLVHSYLFRPKSKMKSPVAEVKFFYQDGRKKLKRIKSVFSEENLLFSTSRKLTIEFGELQGIPIISGYRVEGFQKMILSDTVKFAIRGKMLFR